VRRLVSLLDDRDRSCVELLDLSREHLANVRAQLAELSALESSLVELVEDCERTCLGGPGPDCAVLDNLAHRSGGAG
jgi:hypothetical protein